MKFDLSSTAVAANGVEIPRLGLGTYLSKAGEETQNAVRYAIEIGYRHIDTAAIYGNEADVARGIKDSGIGVEDIFVTTKVWNTSQGYEATIKAFETSLTKLDMDYVDLYLIHWPLSGIRKETWRALCDLYHQSKVRAIGISNYTIPHIEELLKNSPVTPAVNQVEFTPYLNQTDLLDYCTKNEILIEAYSPLVRGKRMNDIRLVNLAQKYGKSSAQILIRWSLQNNMICLPKSATLTRIKENADVYDFEIEETDMQFMNNWNENFRVAWDPTRID